MPASIFGDRVAVSARNGPAWHDIGEMFTDNPTPMDATIRAGCDYEVRTVPLTGRAFGKVLDLNHRAIVRQPTADDPEARVFGVVGPDWEPVQNMEIAALLEGTAKKYPVETVGALDQGQRFFLTLDTGTADLTGNKGGEIQRYIALTDDKTGNGTLRCMLTDVRIVCQNTFSLATASAAFNIQVRHTAGALDEMAFRVQLMERMSSAQESAFDAYRSLIAKQITSEQITEVLRAVYPNPSAGNKVRLVQELRENGGHVDPAGRTMTALLAATQKYEFNMEKAGRFRDQARFVHDRFNAEYPSEANTGWSLVNAIVELEDFGRAGQKDKVGASALFGERAATKAKAFELVMALN